LALAAGRTGKTPLQTKTIASKPAPYHQGEALSAARFVGWLHGTPGTLPENQNHSQPDKIIAQPFRFFNHQKSVLQTVRQLKSS
jgi:hypothetical protein